MSVDRRIKITDRAQGKWKDILTQLGIEPRFLTGKHGPCPMCGGKDRFRWDNKEGRGTYYCAQCGSGNGANLLMAINGWDFKTTVKKIETVIGTAKAEQPKPVMTEEECRANMQRRWNAALVVTAGDPVAKYLRNRLGQDIEVPKVLRSLPDRPGMMAIMQAPNGFATTGHITLLTPEGNKAPTEKVRVLLPGSIAVGSAVRLAAVSDHMGIAEGIETALAAAILFNMPVWAALNEGLLQKFEPPAGVRRLTVFGDNDRNFVGQHAAYSLAKRLTLRRDNPLDCRVMIPDGRGDDWNDVLVKKSVNSQLTPSAA